MSLKLQALKELMENILPFWEGMTDANNTGFYGEADFYGRKNVDAPRGGVLNSRILWTFSAAHRVTGNKRYRQYADLAMDVLYDKFYDTANGGVFWLVDSGGKPLDTKKHIYNQAFAVYALAERYRSAGDGLALRSAINIYETIERYAYDKTHGGYIDAKSVEWLDITDTSLSPKDINCAKTMNTNLHIMEAYTNLSRCYNGGDLRERLTEIIEVTLDKIIYANKRFNLFFENDFTPITNKVSFGHDIEGSWLLCEAAQATGDAALITRVKKIAVSMANWVLENGIDKIKGGLPDYENSPTKAWWPQAEAVVGFYNAYEITGDKKFLNAATEMFDYIQRVFIDKENGEWHNEVSKDNIPDENLPKADMWKCPYHNGRMCLELIERAKE